MHTSSFSSLHTRLGIFEYENTRFAAFQMMNLVKLLPHLPQILRPLFSQLLAGQMLVGMRAEQAFPSSKQEDIRMRFATCQSWIVTANDTLSKGTKQFGMAGSLDLVVFAFATGCDADGDVVFVQVLN